MNEVFDVVVAGGAAIGSSLAYHLAADPGFKGRILVLEPDPGYERAASARSAASIRQQFSAPVNVKLSLYGIEFLRDLGTRLAVDGERPDIGLREGGYLFMADEGCDIGGHFTIEFKISTTFSQQLHRFTNTARDGAARITKGGE